MSRSDTARQVKESSSLTSESALQQQVHKHLDHYFPDLQHVSEAGPSDLSRGKGKRKRTLRDEILHWEKEEAQAAQELAESSAILPGLLDDAQTKLQSFLLEGQKLSLRRYDLSDKLTKVSSELDEELEEEDGIIGSTLMDKMESLHAELERLESGLIWASILEQVLHLSERILSPKEHYPSPLAALPHYHALHELVLDLNQRLPPGLSLLTSIQGVESQSWKGLHDILTSNLLKASEQIKWPSKVQYTLLLETDRRAFERACRDLLFLQVEDEMLRPSAQAKSAWYEMKGLFPLKAMIQPIALRFQYHFQGTKTTNRLDKPEWAFSNILDQIYEHSQFLTTILQPLTAASGFPEVSVKSEFTLLLLPTLLDMLRTRVPKLLDHPALLAHTVYQTILFDDAIRDGGFDIRSTSASESLKEGGEWEGLAGVILKEEGWFKQWIEGEKQFVDAQLHHIISSADAWTITDETIDEDEKTQGDRKPTTSARQVKALIEQITDRYSPLPSLEYKLPFLTTIQLPTLQSYHQRINGSLDAFENLSSAFARAIPGALAGSTRSGVTYDQARLTGGEAGLGRLIKANLSAGWILQAMRDWSDEMFYIKLSKDLRESKSLRWKFNQDPLLPLPIREGSEEDASIYDVLMEMFEATLLRTEDMIIKLVSVEVENDLKEHLKRQWDIPPNTNSPPSQHFLSSLATYTTLLRSITQDLPATAISKLYRRIVSHLTNHITQRAVYSGWSKFTYQGAIELSQEINDYISSTQEILNICNPPANLGIETPWRPLLDAIKVLKLPSDVGEGVKEGVTFSQGMAAAWSDGPETLKVFLDRLGIKSMGRGDLQAILRRRVECWR